MNIDEKNIKEIEETEEIKFDENIDFNTIQNNLQEHMAQSNIEYDAEQSLEEVFTDYDINNVTNESEITNNIDNTDIIEFSNLLSPDEDKKEIEPFQDIPIDTREADMEITEEDIENLQEDSNKKFQTKTETPRELTEGKLKLKFGEKKYVIYIEPDNIDFIESLSIKERKRVINRALKYEDTAVRQKKERKERIKFTKQVVITVLTVICSLPFFFMLLNKSVELTILNYQQTQQNFVKLYKEQGKIKSYKKFQKNFD